MMRGVVEEAHQIGHRAHGSHDAWLHHKERYEEFDVDAVPRGRGLMAKPIARCFCDAFNVIMCGD